MNIFNLCWLKRKVLILFSFFVILTGLIFYGGRSYAADALSLKMLIKNALKNPDITSSALKAEGRKEEIAIAKALPEPVAGIGLTDANGFNNPGIGVNGMSYIGFSISQKIPFPSKLGTKSQINKYSYMSSKAKTRALKINTAYLVKETYYNLALLEKQIIVVKYNRLLLNIILKDISQKYGTGSASAPAYIRTMLEDASLKSELFSLNKAKAELIYLLGELTGLKVSYIKSSRAELPKISEEKKGAKTGMSPKDKLNEKEDIKTAYKFNPELKSLKYLAKKSDYETAYAKESYLPDFYLKAGYGDRYSMVPILSASVGLSLPVYFNSYQKPLINKAEKDRLASIYDISWEKLRIIKNIKVYAKDMRLNKNNYRLYESLYVPEAKLLFKAETASFEVKRSSAFPLLDSFRKLIDSEFKRDTYNAKYYIDKSRLEQVMGKIQ
ncbi:MAG: TolC family protein [Candidatus Acidulodesulfobacterium ferriphilum]|uniref:TolC family protein n=1 Tax=Candidatus Acidulodesulfobacterium ferriphilum TaxID=2597223 RepID=A0A519BDT3_9DELT|nr:MAG: TolC family protein [Candidatus Acidulodesulfobacterium ferriphilum]